jgi:DHA2 family multidrug resistance protein-like MFS transporter
MMAGGVSVQYGEGLPAGRRRLVVFTVAITTILSVLDGTISNVALPTIEHNLAVSSAAVVWVVNGFQLATTMLIVPLTTYGDIAGFARVYRAGVALFVVSSVAGALAPPLPARTRCRSSSPRASPRGSRRRRSWRPRSRSCVLPIRSPCSASRSARRA